MNTIPHGSEKPSVDRHALSKESDEPGSKVLPKVADLSKLEICFGGFSPTAMSGDWRSTTQIEKIQQLANEREEAKKRAAELEAARVSKTGSYTDDEGVVWDYSVLDDANIRIEKCTPPSSLTDLVIPAKIEDMPVCILAADSCSQLKQVKSISMPESVVSIGLCAFRLCPNLETICFSKQLDTYDSDWLRNCNRLHTITLPGQLQKITSKVFDIKSLRYLIVGSGTCEVVPGAFLNSCLESIEVSSDNPVLSTDGLGLYAACGDDATVLLALAVPLETYKVKQGCVGLAKKCFSAFTKLCEVQLPDTLQVVGDFAFTKTSIESFDSPKNLQAIGERSFFDCTLLKNVTLKEGLVSIGNHAFSQTAVNKLHIPSTVENLGNPIAEKAPLIYSGADATFSIDNVSPYFTFDEAGGLYSDDILIRMMEPNAEEYYVKQGTVGVADGAFSKHSSIKHVYFPESLKYIGKGSFKDCHALVQANLPKEIERLGDEAFLGTNLETLFIPKTLTRIGSIALITYGAHHGDIEPSLVQIEVEKENPRFYMEGSLLIERMDNGSSRVIVCTGQDADVVVPKCVNAIAPYAFNGLRRLRSLSISDAVTMVEVRGLAFNCLLERVHIDLSTPIDGHSSFDISFPNTTRAAQQMMLAFSVPSFVNVEAIFEHYDNSIVNASGFDSRSEKGLDPYEQVTRILDRLKDPIFMSPSNRSLADRVLKTHLFDFLVEIARHDDKNLIDALIDFNYLTIENINDAIEHVGAVQDASITNYLLDAKRTMSGGAAIDFEADFEL